MGLVSAVYSWPSVKALHFTVFSMNLAGLVAIFLAILWALRFERGFGDYLNLVSPGDGHFWTAVILVAAVCCSPAYFLGIKCCLCLRIEPTRNDPEDQNKAEDGADLRDVNRLLFVHAVACLLSGFLVVILNATYLALLSGFQQKSRDGLIEAIEKYSSDTAVKARIDAVQSELQCCGDNSYEDWFRVPWLRFPEEAEVVDTGPRLEEQSPRREEEEEEEEEEKIKESMAAVDVPFSCCSNDIPKPCVHHNVLSPSTVYDYNPKYLTISTRGCRSRIISRGEVIRLFLAGYLGFLSVYQVILSLMARLLQTAHSNELYIGPEKTRYHVWIFFKPEDYAETEQKNPIIPRRMSTSPILIESEDEDSHRYSKSAIRSGKALAKFPSRVTFKSKSLPTVKSTFAQRNLRRKRTAGASNSTLHHDEEEERLLPSRVITSDVARNKDGPSVFSLISSVSSLTDLPSPPPVPPLPATDDSKLKQEKIPTAAVAFTTSTKESKRKHEEPIASKLNSGRRVKVLERFGRIWGHDGGAVQRGDCGGGSDSDEEGSSSESHRSRKRVPLGINSTDIYNRFRGSLQHTLARRDTTLVHREPWNAKDLRVQRDLGRTSVLQRLRCTNVPPSYSLLANMEVTKRLELRPQLGPTYTVPPPPPPPPLPPPLTNVTVPCRRRVWKKSPNRICTVCNRPVLSSCSQRSLDDASEDTFFISPKCRRNAAPLPRQEDPSLREYPSQRRPSVSNKSGTRR